MKTVIYTITALTMIYLVVQWVRLSLALEKVNQTYQQANDMSDKAIDYALKTTWAISERDNQSMAKNQAISDGYLNKSKELLSEIKEYKKQVEVIKRQIW